MRSVLWERRLGILWFAVKSTVLPLPFGVRRQFNVRQAAQRRLLIVQNGSHVSREVHLHRRLQEGGTRSTGSGRQYAFPDDRPSLSLFPVKKNLQRSASSAMRQGLCKAATTLRGPRLLRGGKKGAALPGLVEAAPWRARRYANERTVT